MILWKTVFKIPGMDCPSEENMIRLKLQEFPDIEDLRFDLDKRTLTIFHYIPIEPAEQAIRILNLGLQRLSTEETGVLPAQAQPRQRQLLWLVLIINFAFFLVEMITGLVSRSMGLVADSLDMLADAFVYGISLLAVGGTLIMQKRIARLAGYFQIILATVGFLEVIRRFFYSDNIPDFTTMIIVSLLALVANGTCLYLLRKARSKEAHIRASMIFTSNDIIINSGVILAGILVKMFHSAIPDLVVGIVVFIVVMRGAFRILKLGK